MTKIHQRWLLVALLGLAACGAGRNTVDGIERMATDALVMTDSEHGNPGTNDPDRSGPDRSGLPQLQTATFALG